MSTRHGIDVVDLDTADASLEAYFRLLAGTAEGGVVDDDDRYLLFAGGHDYPGTYTNGLIRRNPPAGVPPVSPVELLARADAFFGPLRRPYVAWVRTHRDGDLDAELQRRGYFVRPPAEGSDAVLLTRRELLLPEPDGIDVEETTDEEDYREFLALVASCYGLPDADLDLAEGVLFSLSSLRHPANRLWVARLRETGRMCGGLATYIAEGVGHNAWSVTDPAVRGRGIGKALTLRSAHDSFADGADFVWGVASLLGGPIWRSVGFETVTRHKRYVVPAPPEAPVVTASSPRRHSARPVVPGA